LIDKASEVAPAHIHSDADVTSPVFTIDRSASKSRFHSSKRFQRNDGAGRNGHAHFPDLLDIVARRKGESHHDVEAAFPVPVLSHGNASKCRLEHVLKFFKVEAISGERVSIGSDLDIGHLSTSYDREISGAPHL